LLTSFSALNHHYIYWNFFIVARRILIYVIQYLDFYITKQKENFL